MSVISYIRHGQASFLKEDYDNLSDKGWIQTELLGKHLADIGISINKVFVGPLKRHQQSYESIVTGFNKGGSKLDCEPIYLEGLREHKLPEIMRATLPYLLENDASIKKIASVPTSTDLEKKKVHFRLFEKVFLMWAEEKLEGLYEGHHSFKEFKNVSRETLEHIKQNTLKNENVIVVTSGGPVGASMGEVLELSDKKMLEVSWEVINSSFTSYKLTKNQFRLIAFNAIPHLVEAQMKTLV